MELCSRACRGLLSMFDLSVMIFSNFWHLQNRKSGAETWWEALGLHGDSELLKWLCSDIQDGRILKLFKRHSEHYVGLNWNLMGGIVGHWRFRTTKIALFRYPGWTPWQPSIKSSNHIKPRVGTLSDWAQTWWEALGRYGDSELLKCFQSDIQYGNAAILKLLKPLFLPNYTIKFWLNPAYSLGGDIVWRLSSWPPWQPFWLSELNDLSNSESPCLHNASHRVPA